MSMVTSVSVIYLRWLGAVLVLMLTSCALPVPPGQELGDFVPPEEQLLVSLALEGVGYFNNSRFVDAELRFRQALYLNPELINIKANLAASLERVGNYEEAEDLYRELIEKDPKSVPYELGLGRVFASAGRYQEALQQFEKGKVKAIDAADTANWANAARSQASVSFTIGDEESAECYSSEALGQRGQADEALRHVRLLVAGGKLSDATEVIFNVATALGLEKHPTILHDRAMISFEHREYADALAFEDLAGLTGGIDPAILFEMNMVRNFSLLQLPEKREQTDFDEDAEEEFYEMLVDLRDGNTAMSLYWPASLVELFFTAGLNEEPEGSL